MDTKHEPQPMVTEYFQCQCGSDEHTLKFTMDPDDGQVWTAVFLNDYRSFWQRLLVAVKYLFGYKCRYGHWDCFSMEEADKDRLITLLQKSKEHHAVTNPKERQHGKAADDDRTT